MSDTGREVLRQQVLKLAELNRGKPCTDTRRENIRVSKLGHEVTDDTKEKLRAAMSGENNPNYGKQRSEETKAKIRAAKLGKHHSEETKAIIKLKRANQIFSEETRKKMSESRKGERNPNYGKTLSLEQKQYLSEINSGKNHPMYGKVGAMNGKHHSEETKQKMREAQLIVQNLPEVKQHKSKMLSGEKNPNWNGGPKEYCIKFKYGTFRNRCRSFFNNTCVLCGEPAGEETLDVHHVYYNKKACCDISEEGKYYSDLGIKGNAKTFEIIGSPDKFVALHHKCHSLTTPISEREKYARLFEKIVNDGYDGKCYFTEDEYRTLTM